MAVFDFSDEELSFSRENKSMYLFFMDKSIDISVPHSLPDLLDFFRMYPTAMTDPILSRWLSPATAAARAAGVSVTPPPGVM